MTAEVVAIIGAGQAGFQTASSLRQEGFSGRIMLIGDEPALPYQRPPLSKSYLAGESGLDDLWLRPEAFYETQQIELVIGETVTAIDRPGRSLRLASGGEIACDHVVLAVGARFRPLVVPGAELDGVLPLRTLADADTLRERMTEAHEVVVVGAGFIGLEFAAVARAAGLAVNVLEVTNHPMGRVVSAQTSQFFTGAHIGWGSTISLGTGVARILGANRRVTAVETSDGRVLPADLVLVCDQADLKLQIAGITVGHDAAVVRGDPQGGSFSVFCFRDGRLIGVESVNRPADHIVARRLLAGNPRLLPAQAADESFDLRAHAARKP